MLCDASFGKYAAVSSVLSAGVTPAPPPLAARLPLQRGQQQRQQQPQLTDAKAEALLQARRMADQAVNAFEGFRKICKTPPTVAVHESTQ